MASNSSNACDVSGWFWSAQPIMWSATYTVLPPIYFLFGTPAHLVALIAFTKQYKTNSGYFYQILVTVSKLIHIITFSWYYILFSNMADPDRGPAWFLGSYSLMWYTAHVCYFLESAFITIPTIATAAMAVDLAFSLASPFRYKNKNTFKHHTLAVVVTALLGALISADITFRWSVVENGSKGYKIVSNNIFVGNNLIFNLNVVRNGLRAVALLTVVTGNSVVVHAFRKRNTRIGQMTTVAERKEQKRKASERRLVTLALFQSLTIAVTTIGWTIFNSAYLLWPRVFSCQGQALFYFLDAWVQVVNTGDFYILYMTNVHFKTLIKRSLKHSPGTSRTM